MNKQISKIKKEAVVINKDSF
jgi:hypothetical protein